MSGTENYAGQESDQSVEITPIVIQKRWVRLALNPKEIIEPIRIKEHPRLQEMLQAQGLSIEEVYSSNPRREMYAEHGRPDHDES